MTNPRSWTIVEEEAVYHCVSRCVRRAYLHGEDPYTGKNYDHRKEWIRDRLIFLTKVFTIEVLQCALMDNHEHTMLRTRPDVLSSLSDEEIAKRWLTLYPKPEFKGLLNSKVAKQCVSTLAANTQRIAQLRERLCSISWFMKSLNEYIARRANKEDECKGRFWEGRFKCMRLEGEAAVLSCAVYIDLNPVRAGKAVTPEESQYTSAYERIEGVRRGISPDKLWLVPIESTEERRGFLNMTLESYLRVLDATGRELQYGKRGRIPAELEPILVRTGIEPRGWMEITNRIGKGFSTFVGSVRSMELAANSVGKSWLKGRRFASRAFI